MMGQTVQTLSVVPDSDRHTSGLSSEALRRQ